MKSNPPPTEDKYMGTRSKLEDAIGAISNPLSRGRPPRPAYPDEEELPGSAEDKSPRASDSAPSVPYAPRAPFPDHQTAYRRPRPAKRTPPRTREEVFRRLEGPRVLENYPVGKRFYLDEDYIAMLDELAARFGQPHSEIVRAAIALLYLECAMRETGRGPGG